MSVVPRLISLLFATACAGRAPAEDSAGPPGPPPTATGDSGGTAESDTNGLHGRPPSSPIPAPPSFDGVINMDLEPRTVEDLIGHPTAVWFYPNAASSG